MKNENEFIKIRLKIKFFRAYFRIIIKNQLILISEYREQDHRQPSLPSSAFERKDCILWTLYQSALVRASFTCPRQNEDEILIEVGNAVTTAAHTSASVQLTSFSFPEYIICDTCCGLYAHRTSIHTEWNGGNINSFRQVCWQYGGPIAWQDTIGIISIFCFGMQLTCLRFPIFSLCHSVNGFIAENAIIAFYLHSSTCIHHAMWQILNHDRGTHFIGLS